MGRVWLAVVLGLLWFAAGVAADGVTMAGNDLRTGWYGNQPGLAPVTVGGSTFGKLFSANVVGQVYAQPLVSGGVLLVVTEANHVYGLDPETGAQKWSRAVGTPWNPSDIGCGDLLPTIGVTSTPVIDASGTEYFVAKTYVSGSSGPAAWDMHAVDVQTGVEKSGFPVRIQGPAQNNPGVTFNATNEMQRPGLLLMGGVVYAGFGSHCDHAPWQGWIAGVSTSGSLKALWVSSGGGQSTNSGGVWQSGGGLMSDGPARIFFVTGNTNSPSGPTPGSSPPASLGESAVRLAVQSDGSLKAADFFTPGDAATLDAYDSDYGSGAPTGLPNSTELPGSPFGSAQYPHLMLTEGKQGYVYLQNRDDLGGVQQGPAGSDKYVQRIGPYGGVWSRAALWPGDGGYAYIPTASGNGSSGGNLRVYKYGLDGAGKPTFSLAATSTDAFGWGSGAPVVTSDGMTSGSALVWIVWAADRSGTGGQLRAYDALPSGGHPVLRYSAPIGTAAKYVTPGVGPNGRIYVGTRDQTVIGFGAPITPQLSGSGGSFPTTTIGQSQTQTVTFTAAGTTTINSLSVTGSAFTIASPTPPTPATLTSGQTLTIPVTFTPSVAGPAAGTLTAQTGNGPVSVSLSGNGQTAGPSLSANPRVVSFGGTRTGSTINSTVTYTNNGASPLTFSNVLYPQAPFTATGAPKNGDTLAPGASVTISLAFSPTAVNSYSDSIELDSNGGNVNVGLTGVGTTPPAISVSPASISYGDVGIGATKTASFTITNNGGGAATITRSKPPALGPFTATTALPEGATLAAGATLTETVALKPTALGATADQWSIAADDGSGQHNVQLTGNGVIPDPTAGGWQLNGNAILSGGALQLTAASSNQSGTAFWPTALSSSTLDVSFDAYIGGGSGADGMTMVLADPSRGAKPTSLGANGGGLGFSGIPGLAVALDTYKNSVNPSNNFAGITDGPTTGGADLLHWVLTTSAIPKLFGATHHIRVLESGGTLTVFIDGTTALTSTISLPPNVLLGFSAGTGGSTDRHAVSNVVITTGGPQPPPTLQIGEHVVAPAGAPQAGQTFVVSGNCPSALTTPALGDGATATPTLTGAAAGSACSLSQTAPAATGWTAAVSVNGGPAQPLTASGGLLAVPAFNLSSGVNTVVFTNTYATPSTSLIPDPSAGGWTLNGSAAITGTTLNLTHGTTTNEAGTAFWPSSIAASQFTVSFDAYIGGGSGADGMTMVLADPSRGAKPTSLGANGGGLGFSGIPGLAVALDTYKNSVNPSNNFAGITDGPAQKPDLLHWQQTTTAIPKLFGATRHLVVGYSAGTLTVSIDGATVMTRAVALPSRVLLGFSGGTGGLTDRHSVSHFSISAGPSGLAVIRQVPQQLRASAPGRRLRLQIAHPKRIRIRHVPGRDIGG